MINFIIKQRGAIINYFGFSVVWICCASTPALGKPLLAPIVTIIFLLLHFSIIAYKRDRELKLIIFSVILGIIVDSGFSIMNIVKYNGVISSIPNLAPIWILCMWAGFASQVNYAMKYLRGKYPLIAFYGLLAPLALSCKKNSKSGLSSLRHRIKVESVASSSSQPSWIPKDSE